MAANFRNRISMQPNEKSLRGEINYGKESNPKVCFEEPAN
jgi:hypothetical protein